MKIDVHAEDGVFYAVAYDNDGKEIDRLAALTRKNARKLMKAKLGLIKASRVKLKPDRIKANSKEYGHAGVMSNLSTVTSSKDWKNTK